MLEPAKLDREVKLESMFHAVFEHLSTDSDARLAGRFFPPKTTVLLMPPRTALDVPGGAISPTIADYVI